MEFLLWRQKVFTDPIPHLLFGPQSAKSFRKKNRNFSNFLIASFTAPKWIEKFLFLYFYQRRKGKHKQFSRRRRARKEEINQVYSRARCE